MEVINNCGVIFLIWEKRNVDGKGSGIWDWISFMGDDRKKFLREFFKRLVSYNCLQKNICYMVI